jgi:hypothetical protein
VDFLPAASLAGLKITTTSTAQTMTSALMTADVAPALQALQAVT